MTRKEVQNEAITLLKKMIERDGADAIFCRALQPGKNTWTLQEALDSVIEDRPMEGNSNLIDDFIKFKETYKNYNMKISCEN